MKRILVYALLVMGIPLSGQSSGVISGVLAYVQDPLDINKEGEVMLQFSSKVPTSITYFYTVYNASGHQVAHRSVRTTTLRANEILYVGYVASAGSVTLGANRLVFEFKTTEDSNFRIHTRYFYGYKSGTAINLNNSVATSETFYNEIQFVYNGYEAGTVVYRRTSFATSHLNGTLYFANDFFYDLSAMFFHSSANYAGPFYEQALLYIKDVELFPYLSRVKGEVLLELALTKNDYKVSFTSLKQLYVDPLTHNMRSEYRSGYVATDKLYFPLNAYGKVDLLQCRLEVKGYSFSKFNLVYDFHLSIGVPFLKTGGEHEVVIVRY